MVSFLAQQGISLGLLEGLCLENQIGAADAHASPSPMALKKYQLRFGHLSQMTLPFSFHASSCLVGLCYSSWWLSARLRSERILLEAGLLSCMLDFGRVAASGGGAGPGQYTGQLHLGDAFSVIQIELMTRAYHS